MSNPICLTTTKLNFRVVKRCAKQLLIMVNDATELVVIVVVTIKNIDDNLQIKREACAFETQISHPLQRLSES